MTVSPEEFLARPALTPADFKRLTLDGQLEALQRANPQEKQQLAPIFRERFNGDIDKVPEEEQELFFRRMAAAGVLGDRGGEPSPAQGSQQPPVVTQKPLPIVKQQQAAPPEVTFKASDFAPQPAPQDNTFKLGELPRATDPCRAPPSAQEQRRPPNGYESDYDHTVKGYGELTVVNGNSEDAAVMLSSSAVEAPDRLFYVRAGMEATITEIPPGRYRVEFQIGKNWDSEAEIFECVLATAIFEHGEVFEEQRTETDVQYSHVHLTLHKVVGGNARTTPLDPSAFRRRRRIR